MAHSPDTAPTLPGIRTTGRPGSSAIPRWRIEDTSLDPHTFRIAAWLSSHAGNYLEQHVTRNEVARRTGVSAGKVSKALEALVEAGIVSIETIAVRQSEGGRRLLITFNFDTWETPPARSPDDHPRPPGDRAPVTSRPTPGHPMTATTDSPIEDPNQGTNQPLPLAELVPTSSTTDPSDALIDAAFAEFWQSFPATRRTNRPGARQSFGNAAKAHGLQAIADGLRGWWSAEWNRDRSYAPMPVTWLNQARYLDVPEAAPSAPTIADQSRSGSAAARAAQRAAEFAAAEAAEAADLAELRAWSDDRNRDIPAELEGGPR